MHRGALLVLSIGACRNPTEIVLEVDTNADCASVAMAGVRIGARDTPEGAAADRRATAHTCADGHVGSLVLVPSRGKSDAVAIEVVGALSGDVAECNAAAPRPNCIVARRRVRFAAHESLHLPIQLRAACAGLACPQDQTCVDGVCRGADIDCAAGSSCDESTLPPALDARDAGRDVGTDAGVTRDGGTDAGAFSVLLLYAELDPNDAKIVAAGLAPQGIDATRGIWQAPQAGGAFIPGPNDIAAYDAVLVWSETAVFDDPQALGDALATFVEGGGHLVMAGRSFATPPQGIGGRVRNYALVTRTIAGPSQSFILDKLDPASALLAGVNTVTGQSPDIATAATAGIVLASWETLGPAAVRGAVDVGPAGTVNRVDLVLPIVPFHPTSSGWTGDGWHLIANALRYH
jgi:hypothetical protein